jgi:hypothetical protein
MIVKLNYTTEMDSFEDDETSEDENPPLLK